MIFLVSAQVEIAQTHTRTQHPKLGDYLDLLAPDHGFFNRSSGNMWHLGHPDREMGRGGATDVSWCGDRR